MTYMVSGIGFLGAGVSMRKESNVRGGLNTAATLWGSAAVGAARRRRPDHRGSAEDLVRAIGEYP